MKGKCDRLYKIWYNAISRCTNPSDISYKRYGGRGITFYPEWISDYHAFKNWALSNGYQENLTLDRIDSNKGYSPDNCRWATIREQANNRCTNVLYTIDGEKKLLQNGAEHSSSLQTELEHELGTAGMLKTRYRPLTCQLLKT